MTHEKIGVQAEQDRPAYRSLKQSVSLDGILCFKHRRKVSRDNTVKYRRRTLQLLPDVTRPTYARVQEELDGRLLVQCQGQTIPSQEAPPRPGLLRETAASPLESSGLARGINGAGDRWDSYLAALVTGEADRDLRPRKSRAQQHRIPTPRLRTLWENVQQAKFRGLSLRAIARELGIHGNTVRKYTLAESPPLRKIKSASRTPQPEMGAPA